MFLAGRPPFAAPALEPFGRSLLWAQRREDEAHARQQTKPHGNLRRLGARAELEYLEALYEGSDGGEQR